MKKQTLSQWIKSTCSSIGWKMFIWGLDISQEKYWDNIYEQEVRGRLYASGFGRRRVGNSTRIVDHLIQNFFIKGKCEVYDHHPTREAAKRVFNAVLLRLKYEHNIHDYDISINTNKLILTYKKHELYHN